MPEASLYLRRFSLQTLALELNVADITFSARHPGACGFHSFMGRTNFEREKTLDVEVPGNSDLPGELFGPDLREDRNNRPARDSARGSDQEVLPQQDHPYF
eukprot:10393820-Alexandrium_andersonii.AAC.1